MHLGKTPLVKHSIRFMNNTPIKEHYQHIPLIMYEEVQEHLEKMLEIGAVWPSPSPWSNPIILM